MNKKIRLTTAFILTVVMAFSASVSVFAESIYANIDSARVSIKIPEEFTVTSSELNPDDEITYSAEAAMSDTAKQLSIKSSKSAYSTDIYNFKYLTEEQIKSELSAIKSSGATFSGEIFKNVSNAAFKETPEYILFSLYYSSIQNNTTVNYAVAYTLVNGEYIKIKYSSASGFDNKDMEIFQSIIDSVYVQALYDKPEKVNMPGILHTMFIAVIIIALLISGCLALYYVKKKSSIIKAETAKRRRKLSDKYFNELKNEGLMEDTKAEAEEFISENINNTETVIEPSENVRPRNPEEISAIIEEASRNPSLIQDEWEDVDIKNIQDMFKQPDEIPEEEFAFENNIIDLDRRVLDNLESSDIVDPDITVTPSYHSGRADSAKRYAKLFIGSDIDHKHTYENDNQKSEHTPEYYRKMAEIEERQRKRKSKSRKSSNKKVFSLFGSSDKKKKSTGRSRAHSSSSERRGNRHTSSSAVHHSHRSRERDNDAFTRFETDGYWDKYR